VIVIGGYILIIMILWHMPYIKAILYPFKMVTVAFHEFGHAITALCTGGKVKSIKLDPNEGGATQMVGGVDCITLPAGYLGSAFFGGIMVFCGFNLLASKILGGFLAFCLLLTLWWARNWLARIIAVVFIGLIIAGYFILNGEVLRYFVLFMGVMSALYSIWDILEDLVFRKVNESDASKFAKLCPLCCPAQCWGCIWWCISMICLLLGIGGGLLAFYEPPS